MNASDPAKQEKQDPPIPSTTRKPYSKPKLICHGSVPELTGGRGSLLLDAGGRRLHR